MNHLVIGLGQAGKVLMKVLFNAGLDVDGIDANFELYGGKKYEVLHVCFPCKLDKEVQGDIYDDFLFEIMKYYNMFLPKFIVIHSTVPPGTTEELQKSNILQIKAKIFYSPIRGQHTNLEEDLKRYSKFFAPPLTLESDKLFTELSTCFKKIKFVDNTPSLEMAKLLDTTAYGVGIFFAQLGDRICKKYGLDYDIVREFGRETHEFYGLKPDYFPGVISGNCVMQNIDLLEQVYQSELWNLIKESNNLKKKELNQSI